MLVQAHVDFSRTFLTTFFLFHMSRLPVFSIGYPRMAMIFSYVFWVLLSFRLWLEYIPLFLLVGLVYLMSFGTRHFGLPLRCIHLFFRF